MIKTAIRLLPLCCLLSLPLRAAPSTITFPAEDGITVTADLFMAHSDKSTPFIVLFHQAGWSRGEYREIAPRLNELGFNCMAVDQRSGNVVNQIPNLTAQEAKNAGKRTGYIDALTDMRAAIKFARENYAQRKLLIWGSSYSAALVLVLAAEQPVYVHGVLAFSPGEYFKRIRKPTEWIREAAAKIQQPVFVASARSEKGSWIAIFNAILSESKTSFLPTSKGNHGSRALWQKYPDHDTYWDAVEDFLDQF